MSRNLPFSNINYKWLKILFALNLLTSLIVFFWSINSVNSDEKGYWMMGESFFHGKFSSWYFLDTYYPETLRTPGYPLFLYLIRSIIDNRLAVLLIQLLLYYASLFFVAKSLWVITERNLRALFVFLLLSAINIQIPFYAGQISADILSIFFTSAYLYIVITRRLSPLTAIILGLVAGLNVQARPAFLLFPFVLLAVSLFKNRFRVKIILLHVVVFIISLMPFGYWNYKNHGVFKVTPIEGGAGVAHIGYWSFKLPKNYVETYYWGNKIYPDLLNPFIYDDVEIHKNQVAFEKEWQEILDSIEGKLTSKEKNLLKFMKESENGLFPLYNSHYTQARESLLIRKTAENIKSNLGYYFKTRLYTFFRLYFTGINLSKYRQSGSIFGLVSSLLPFAITFLFILVGFLISAIVLFKRRFLHSIDTLIVFLVIFYQGFVHIPFAIQSRYTVPVQLFILLLLSMVLSRLNWKRTCKFPLKISHHIQKAPFSYLGFTLQGGYLTPIDEINFNQRNELLNFGACGTKRHWKMKQQQRSGRYTTRWREIVEVF